MGLSQAIAIVLIALALAPVPPILPRKQTRAGGNAAYSIGLLAGMGLISIVWIPLALSLLGRFSALPVEVPIVKVAMSIAISILAPLAAGTVIALAAPGLSAKLAPAVSKVGGVLLLLTVLAVVASQWKAMGELIGDGTVLAFAIFSIAGLAVGHLLGRPDEEDRTVLAMATSIRHPGVALAIAAANFPDTKVLMAAVLLFLITSVVVSIPYVAWRKRVGAAGDLAIA
jgi:BASS family bile acid:Na+ symporter